MSATATRLHLLHENIATWISTIRTNVEKDKQMSGHESSTLEALLRLLHLSVVPGEAALKIVDENRSLPDLLFAVGSRNMADYATEVFTSLRTRQAEKKVETVDVMLESLDEGDECLWRGERYLISKGGIGNNLPIGLTGKGRARRASIQYNEIVQKIVRKGT